MSEPKRDFSFRSPEEFSEICHQLAMSMHHKNRVAMGERSFVCELAEVIRRAGLVFGEGLGNPQVSRDFGAAYQTAELSRDEQAKALIDMLFPKSRG